MTMLRWDRNLLGLERSLGLRSERGISRQSNKDAPPIEQLLDSIKLIARRWVAATNREIRTSEVLKQDALGLFDEYGPTIWPDDGIRPSWLEEPSDDAYEGRYPRDLFYSDPDDREVLSSYFCDLVVEKCIKYHDNQLQKHRRLSKVHSATPTKQNGDSEDDNDDSALLDRLEASVEAAGEIGEAEIVSDSRPTWAPVNKQPEARGTPDVRKTPEQAVATVLSMPAPTSPVSVMTTAAKSEPSYGDFSRYYVTGGESPEPEIFTQPRLRASAQADKLRATEERRDSAVAGKDANRAGSAPAHPGSLSRKRPRAIDPDEPVFRVKRKRGGAKWSWMFTFKVDPEKLRRILAGERVAPPIVNEESDYYWSEDEDEPSRDSVDIDWHDKDEANGESKAEPEDEAEPRPQAEPQDDTVRVGSSRSKSAASWDGSIVSDYDKDVAARRFSPLPPGDSATPIVEHAAACQEQAANACAEGSEDIEMIDAGAEDSEDGTTHGFEKPSQATSLVNLRSDQDKHHPEPALPRSPLNVDIKRPKERQSEFNNLRGIIADALHRDPERRLAVDIPSFSSDLANLLESMLYQRCVSSGAAYHAKVRQLKRTLRTDAQLIHMLIRRERMPPDVVRMIMESPTKELSSVEPILLDSPLKESNGTSTGKLPIQFSAPVQKQDGLAEAQRRASDAATGANAPTSQSPAVITTNPVMSPNATPVRRSSSHTKPVAKPPSLVKPLVTQPRHDQIVGFRASGASPTARAFEETRIDDIVPPSGNPANFRALSAAPTQGKFQIAPPNTHRCVCQKQPSPYDAGQLIQCGNCKVMQHKICMGVPTALPRGHLYCCEQCRPDAHVETVRALQKGHRIWEMRATVFHNQQIQQQHRVSNSPQVQAPPAPPATQILQSSVAPGHAHQEPPRPPVLPSQSPSVQPRVVSFGNSLPSQHMKPVSKPRATPAPPYQTEIMSQELGRRIMGDMMQMPVVQLILQAGSSWTEDQLLDLKAALVEVPAGGHDLSLLAKHLFQSRHSTKQDAAASPSKQESASNADSDAFELDVEVNWNRDLDFNDSLPMPDAITAEDFFLQLEAELPDEIRDEQKTIKEVRVKSLTELKCGPFSRIVRGKAGDAGLRSVRKKLKSLEKDVEPELQFFIVWQDKARTASVGA
ncbi:hypothetical protein DOTSEDRAFT_55191 [Dothistroma septosporum NZE10]|uniref:Zinc finger PHD-type domain-containing protein n=1 Tax=Dothistroma septosporum (strain NZE10 / CBS 128990) TaxID=675120 RepID=N1PIH9_DOTSN|nr:hypothetical protein DOTSEDRAFT_55191 [Dothistroma septosporum NZE10]